MTRQYISGDTVPESGIYRVAHHEHRLPHEVTLLEGQRFPACSKCDLAVRFSLLRQVSGIHDRREQILLYRLPEVEAPADSVPDSLPDFRDGSVSAGEKDKKQHKPRAKAQRKGKL